MASECSASRSPTQVLFAEAHEPGLALHTRNIMLSTDLTSSTSSALIAKSTPRSDRPEVRNPLVLLPAAQRMNDLPEASRAALRALLLDLRDDARARAKKAWFTHKAPLAVYWKVVSVYAYHLARLLAPREA